MKKKNREKRDRLRYNQNHEPRPKKDLSVLIPAWEEEETLRCQVKYFLGPSYDKKQAHFERDGFVVFDDDNGFYRHLVGDHVLFRYEILGVLGHGAFGQVYEAYDHKKSRTVALKIPCSRPGVAALTKDEVRLLAPIAEDPRGRSSVVRLLSYNNDFRGHPVLAFEVLKNNLYDVIEKTNKKGLSEKVARRMAFSLLQGVEYLHSKGIVHSDLKPYNLALRPDNRGVKILDLGHAFFSPRQPHVWFQTLNYRSPEVFLGVAYCKPIDIWSYGCIVAELLTGQPLLKSRGDFDQVNAIFELCGDFPASLVQRATTPERALYDEETPLYTVLRCKCRGKSCDWDKWRGPPGSKTLEAAMKGRTTPIISDLIRRCLELEPNLRMKAKEALDHPWFGAMRRDERRGHVDLFAE